MIRLLKSGDVKKAPSARVPSRLKMISVMAGMVLLSAGVSVKAYATTYYIAANGSDSNSGTSQTTPWLHAPGMPNCTATCASTTINAGDSIIFRGGDVWHYGNSALSPYTGSTTSGCSATTCGWIFSRSGTSTSCNLTSTTSCIYIGVDQTWFSGSSWVRPVFMFDNPIYANSTHQDSSHAGYVTACSFDDSTNNGMVITGSYVHVDNLEVWGKCWTLAESSSTGRGQTSPSEFVSNGTGDQFSNIYVHGWTEAYNPQPNGGSTFMNKAPIIAGGTAYRISYSVFDGSDSTCFGSNNCTGGMVTVDVNYFDHNVARYLSNVLSAPPDAIAVHDNLFEHDYEGFDAASHGDVVFMYGNRSASGSSVSFYNNMIRNNGMGQTINLTKASGASNVYVFNNTFLGIGNSVNCMLFSSNDTTNGSYYIVNNTFDSPCLIGTSGNAQPQLAHGTIYLENNHVIGFSSSTFWSNGNSAPVTFQDDGSEVLQTEAVANGQGYTSTNNYQPTSTSGATYHAGVNLSSSCSTYSSDSALCSGSSGGVTNTAGTGNTPTPYIASPPARGSTWDSGAYEYVSQSGSQPNPPSGLAATVQ